MDLMDNSNGQLDTSIRIITPENIAFRYQVAGPFRRLLAYLIDLLIRVGICLVGAILLGIVSGALGLPGLGTGAVFIFWFFVFWFYGGLFETFWNGQTPGKRALRLRVLSVDGQPVGALQAIMRNILRVTDAQPGWFYLVGLVAAASNDRYQRLGDQACGTMVVVDEPNWFFGMIRVDQYEAIQLAARIPARFQTSPSMARALAAYVQRRQSFPWGRRLEIARHLAEPLRQQFGLPPETNPDLLLCALYHRTFITDRDERLAGGAGSPFATPSSMDSDSPFASFDHSPQVVPAMAAAGTVRPRP